MDIHQHAQLIAVLEKDFRGQAAEIQFTQWDSDGEDEEVTQFRGELSDVRLSDNEFGEKDLQMSFAIDGDQVVDILMEIPADEEDLAAFVDGRLSIFGTEAEIVLKR
ncbi:MULTISPECIES: hypothetical protein [Bacillales]|jgi:hypothetical protein|uniref:Sterol carrier protein n=1 Tax=Brevibacillus aydinogluensis TaxID=927786 RepID=A0AA48M8D5_9BACL|nr:MULTISPECIES: hypothetical protein [Bacillales]REK61484.1 MAG: hypothetical protein DF221_16290 [Brevibacillus sp.]MBR8660317.1 hypothetical protein [Brevibacillus sp. NL20B1]MDT3416521.1 hypothetical protein [Brevibacillus aydinogluensis]NNV03538.1 hypothetical protein [Brevibacillus sp. MCWH]UFJ60191.1 hypothetical protein IRT44_12915 [Anoxybacillus sediminis]